MLPRARVVAARGDCSRRWGGGDRLCQPQPKYHSTAVIPADAGIQSAGRSIIQATLHDITDRNQALDALQEAEKSEWGAEAREFFEFIRSSKRGTCTSNRLAEADATDADITDGD